MTIIHSWARGIEQPGAGPIFDLDPGEYHLAADMPVTLERRVSRTPPVTETRYGQQYGQHRRQHEVQVEPAKSVWEPVPLTDGGDFAVAETGVFQVIYGRGKGRVTLETLG